MTPPSQDIQKLLKLSVESTQLHATLRIEAAGSAAESITRQELCEFIEGEGIQSEFILVKEIDQLISLVCKEPSAGHEGIVARGREPVHGTNATVDFTPEIRAQFERIERRRNAFLKAQEDNAFGGECAEGGFAIDFYKESSLIIVKRGQIVAKLNKKSAGEDGCNLYGKPVAAKQGKDMDNLLDESCSLDNKADIRAEVDGHLTFKNNQVRVHTHLEVDGHVDFSTGNIDFPGPVTIGSGVRDRFEIYSLGTLTIKKLVEAAHLNSESEIVLQQGMAGRDTGTINAKGNFSAAYLESVNAVIAGDCGIKSELTNCNIYIAGSIDAPRAAIRGGQVNISRGGTVGTIGSIQGVKTEIIVGQIHGIEQKMRRVMELLPKLEAELEKRHKVYERFKATLLGKSTPKQDAELAEKEADVRSLVDKRERLELAEERLGILFRTQSNCKLTVNSVLYAKTELWLPGHHAKFEKDVKGEFTIELDTESSPVLVRGDSVLPLNSVAKVRPDERILPMPKKSDEDARKASRSQRAA
ncbi:MAG: FapA family protein [Phycisphaerales bacterium]